jgi:ABC-type multidrug transport system fused ATPase/permease subunit
MKGRGVLWILSRISLAEEFGQILVVDDGKAVEKGSFDELNRTGSTFHRLLSTQ